MKKGSRELALAKALRAHPPQDADAPLVTLARDYARSMDAGAYIMEALEGLLDDPELEPLVKMMERLEGATTLAVLGPGYRQVLAELGFTAKTRAAMMRGQPQEQPKVRSALDELRDRREQRGA